MPGIYSLNLHLLKKFLSYFLVEPKVTTLVEKKVFVINGGTGRERRNYFLVLKQLHFLKVCLIIYRPRCQATEPLIIPNHLTLW